MFRIVLCVLAVVSFTMAANDPAWLSNDSIWKAAQDSVTTGNYVPYYSEGTLAAGWLKPDLFFTPTNSIVFWDHLMTISHFNSNLPSIDSMEISVTQKPIVKKTKDGWIITFKKKGVKSCAFSWLF